MLTRGLRRPELRRKEDDDDDRRRRGRALVEEGDAEVAGVLGLRKSAPGTPVEVIRGVKGARGSPASRNCGGGRAHRWRPSGGNSDRGAG
jgi:hypothetical protein